MTTFSDAVREVKAYIADRILPEMSLDATAEAYVWAGIEKGDNGNGEMSAEISARESRTGTPVPFTFTAVNDE